MARFRWSTAGESHGAALLAVIEGVPFGWVVDLAAIDAQLARRQQGFGRSARQQLEQDRVEVIAGLYHGRTSGAPLVLRIRNQDRSLDELPPVHRPRPGHADLAGAFKFDTNDARPILERASARETAARVAAGAIAKQILAQLGVRVEAFVRAIGTTRLPALIGTHDEWVAARERSAVWCPDDGVSAAMCAAITRAGADGNTLGGLVEVHASGVAAGLGSLMQAHTRLDARIAGAFMAIPSVKAVELGDGIDAAARTGRDVHDAIASDRGSGQIVRSSNHAGGIEGGMSNGQDLIVRAFLKPLSTLKQPLASVDLRDGSVARPDPQRSDVCAVPAGAVVAEHVLGLVVLESIQDVVPADTIRDLTDGYSAWKTRRRGLPGQSA